MSTLDPIVRANRLKRHPMRKLVLGFSVTFLVGLIIGLIATGVVNAGIVVIVVSLLLPIVITSDSLVLGVVIALTLTRNVLFPLLYHSGMVEATVLRDALIGQDILSYGFVLRKVIKIVVRKASFSFNRSEKLLLLYSLAVVAYFAVPDGVPLLQKGIASQGLLVAPLYFFVGRFSNIHHSNMKRLLNLVIWIGTISSIFGLMIICLWPSFWSVIDIAKYWVDIKKFPLNSVVAGLPGNFYRTYIYIGGGVFVGKTLRLINLTGDPLSTGYNYITYVILVAATVRATVQKWFLLCLGFVCVYLSLTRAALISLLFVLVVFISFKYGRYLISIALSAVYAGIALVVLKSHGIQGSALGHLQELQRDMRYLPTHPFGFGLGTHPYGGLGENTIFLIWAWIGVIPALVFLWFLLFQVKHLRSGKPLSLANISFYLVLGYMVTGIFSNEMLTETAAAIFWIILGISNQPEGHDISVAHISERMDFDAGHSSRSYV